MFKANIKISQESDLEKVVMELAGSIASRKVDHQLSEIIVDHFRSQIGPILDRGKNLAESGSKMSVGSTVEGEGYKINVKARFGIKQSLWQRLLGRS